jgi:hypothetical protein
LRGGFDFWRGVVGSGTCAEAARTSGTNGTDLIIAETIHFQAHHFRSDLTDDESRELFRTSVRYVEIELFTYCNRKCWFCPNAKMPERQDKAGNQYMDDGLYLRILDELASIDYCGQIQFGRYNEPLADHRTISARIKQARDRLPKAWLYSHTNGDFLTPRYLDLLGTAGLNELCVQTYLGNDQRWDEAAILARQAQQLDKLGLKIRKTRCSVPGFRHHVETDYSGTQYPSTMLVTLDARNFDRIGTDRGGLLPICQDKPRTAPCMIPFERLYVDWTGDTMPCCNLRSDRPEHAAYVACRLQDGNSIFAAFAALHGWRKSLMRFGPKAAPCSNCRYDEDSVGAESAPDLERIYARIKSFSDASSAIRDALASDTKVTCP